MRSRKGLWEGVMEVHAFGQKVVGRTRSRRDVISVLSEKKIPDSPQGIYGGSERSRFEIPGETSASVLDTRGLEALVVVSVWFSRPYEERWGQRVAFYLLRRVERVLWLLGEG